MRLASLLAALTPEELGKIREEHLRTDEVLSHAQLCLHLESSIRSSRFLSDFIVNRQPPTFSLLDQLLDAPGLELVSTDLRARVDHETKRICEQLDSREILGRDDALRVYRRMFSEARRCDNDINGSESSLLGVYRREHGIPLVAHYLIEHHSDFREFWSREGGFEHELGALTRAGILFQSGDKLVLPEDLVSGVMQAIGLELTTEAMRRLLEHLTGGDMAAALERQGIKSSGSRAEREERVLQGRLQPSSLLEAVGIHDLKEICRKIGLAMNGNRDDLLERIVGQFASGRDVVVEAPPPEPLREPRRLDESRFGLLFGVLKNQELLDILRQRDLKQGGTKEQRVSTLWEAHLSEETLLGELLNRDLEEVLERIGLRVSGSKPERLERLLAHFAGQAAPSVESTEVDARVAEAPAVPPEILLEYQQHASSSQATLQNWLERLLDAPGLVRCYATEVANPTQQLKNKLAQAAAVRDGLLVLTLADAGALAKAESALSERWASNEEWSKSVACVALAQPANAPIIEVFIERAPTPYASRLRERLFPSARVVRLAVQQGARCAGCNFELPGAARFCPNCGTAVPKSQESKGLANQPGHDVSATK